MAPLPNPDNSALSNLQIRILSALALAPPVLAALYFGPPYSDLLILIAGSLGAWEWARLCRRGTFGLAGAMAVVAVALALIAGSLGYQAVGFLVVAAGTLAGWFMGRSEMSASAARWLGFGVLYLGLACLAFQWLRQDLQDGLKLVIWLVAVVWATDIGAYFAGRGIGGPKLAPKISPNKTWAGLIGGMAAAALVSLAFVALNKSEVSIFLVAVLGAILAAVSQMGDLLESSLKRRFDAKDSSNLIPGHGGVLDRADGLLAASLGLALLKMGLGVSF